MFEDKSYYYCQDSLIEAGPSKAATIEEKTLFVRKSVKVQDYSDPLMTIRDQLAKVSPPPQCNEESRPETPPPGPCTIFEDNLDLVDGLRVLTRVGPHFYPGSVKTIESPSIFAVTVDGERGNKPHIYSAEELLNKTILEVRPGSTRYTPLNTRVCVFWSNKLNFLYPGTVKNVHTETQYVSVKLDDGDERDIKISNVRLLPKGYPKVNAKDKESPIGVVEANTLSPVAANAIQFTKSPSEKKQKENEFDETNGMLKLKSSSQVQKKSGQGKGKEVKSVSALKTCINDPTLTDENLKDGMRILTLKDGHFYPGRLNATRPPDIYGVLFDNERGFRPVIYAREQLLKDSVKEMKVKSPDVPVGSRVCVYWSAKYQYLHPATIAAPLSSANNKHANEKYLNVVLDDGDTREISIDQMRFLPPNYPKVEYPEDYLSPRKKGSRPGSRADTPKTDNSRPSSSLSNMSDSDRDSSIKSPLSPLKVNGVTPPLSRDNTPLNSPKPHPKVIVPEPAAKPATFDLVGMISSGIDKLVDKKKVVGSRPGNYPPSFQRPSDNMMQHRPPGAMSPPPPNMTPNPYVMSPNHYSGYHSPHPHYPPQSPHPNFQHPNYQHPPQSPHPNFQHQHYQHPPPSPHYQHPPSSQHQGMHTVPHHPPPQQPKPISPPPPLESEAPQLNGDASKLAESENKAKSRLSNLIQAMSGKIKKPDTPAASPADQILNKWQLAFNVKPPTTPTKSPSKADVKDDETDVKQDVDVDTKETAGYVTSAHLVSGTKLLVLKANILYSASIANVAPNKMYGIRFRSPSFPDVLQYSEQDLFRNSVLDKEIVNGLSLANHSRVAISAKGGTHSWMAGVLVDYRNGVYVVQMDANGSFEEAGAEQLRMLPKDYPKNKVSSDSAEEKAESKHKHKHNILLGYDFVDENDTDIVAWDKAIKRRRKADKAKSVSPPLSESDIKQEEDLDVKEMLDNADQETKENINAEVNQSVQSMLDQVSLEDRMRISLLSNMLKKYSPKKDVTTKTAGNKSPKQSTEVIKKKRKGSKDSPTKRLSLEDDDLSSELMEICKESNIDISKQESEPVQLENKIEEIVSKQQTEEPVELSVGDSDKLTIDENEAAEAAEEASDDKPASPAKKGVGSMSFSYQDPAMPDGWYVMIKQRPDGKIYDTFYFTPCNTKLRSVAQIKKFLAGKIKSKPLKKLKKKFDSLPKRSNLPQEKLELTKDLPNNIFRPSENEKEDSEHVFKVPSLESFRSQKNKSSKPSGPNGVEESSEDSSQQSSDSVKTEEDSNEETKEKKRVLRSSVVKEDSSDEEEEEVERRKTRSQSNSESESENEEDRKQSETSGSENEAEEVSVKRKKRKVTKDFDSVKDENGSDKENEAASDKVETEPINGKHPRSKRAIHKARPEPKKRTLRSNTAEEENEVKIESEVKEEDVKAEPMSEDPVVAPKISKKRKASDEADDERLTKKPVLSSEETKSESDSSCENNNSPSTSKKLLGPKSQRKAAVKSSKKMLGPKSKRNSTGDEMDEDELEEYNERVSAATVDYFKKKHHPKISIGMTSLFERSLCKASCGHCQETGQYTIHLVEFDMPAKVASMECTSCNWTTVRKLNITTKLIP